MGWLWSDSKTLSAPLPDQKSPETAQSSTTSQPSSQNSTTPSFGDESADHELNSFLKELDADINPSSTKYNRVPRDTPSSFKPRSRRSRTTDGSSEPLSEQLLPTTMSCRTAFDDAFYCNSFGGRWNDLYRYGTLKSCSDNWNNFWFCMRTRTYPEKEKEAAVKEHYRKLESSKYAKELGKDSSEDVWKSRDMKVEPGVAFNEPFPDIPKDDDEWRRKELESRMGKVNGTMG